MTGEIVPNRGNHGYKKINLGGKVRKDRHRVMMEQHLGRKLKPSEIVHHKNEDKSDDRPENFQLMTDTEHKRLHFQGENSVTAKITEKTAKEIKKLLSASEMMVKEIANKFGVSRHLISDIKNGRTWKHI